MSLSMMGGASLHLHLDALLAGGAIMLQSLLNYGLKLLVDGQRHWFLSNSMMRARARVLIGPHEGMP